MKKIFKKNQIIITALALMIAVAGYLQYTGSEISDESATQEASSEVSEDTYEISDEDMFQVEDIFTDTEDNSLDTIMEESNTEGVETAEGSEGAGIETASIEETETTSLEAETTEITAETESIENPGEAVLTSSSVGSFDFAAEVKLNREQIRSKNKESLMSIINNAGITEAQKQDAVDAMIHLTDVAEREAAAEMLLEAKGFTQVVVSITDENADVVLDMGEVTDAKRAQIEDIVKRKTDIAAENIVITPIQTTAETTTD